MHCTRFSPHLLVLSIVFLVTTSGCSPEVIDCTTDARASVHVIAADSSGAAVSDTSVNFSLDDGLTFAPCDEVSDGRWVCGWEIAGSFVLRAEAPGYVSVNRTVIVEADECHVIGTSETLTLEQLPTNMGWEEARSYYVQLIEDPEDCANSWELFSMNCYQIAEFCPDGSVMVIVTDIVNAGRYDLDEDIVQIEFTSPGDMPSFWNLQVQEDGNLRDSFDVVWLRDPDFGTVGEPFCD